MLEAVEVLKDIESSLNIIAFLLFLILVFKRCA